MRLFNPDVLIAVGGGSAMDAAKKSCGLCMNIRILLRFSNEIYGYKKKSIPIPTNG